MGIWGYHSLDVQHVILLFSMAHSTTRWWCAAGSNDKRLPLGIRLPFGEHLDLIAQREYNPAYIKYSIHIWIHWITLKYKYNVHMSHMYITMAIGTSLLYISHILITHRHSISARSSAWCSSWRAPWRSPRHAWAAGWCSGWTPWGCPSRPAALMDIEWHYWSFIRMIMG